MPRTVLSASCRRSMTVFPTQSKGDGVTFEDLCVLPVTGGWCWGQVWQFWAEAQREHEHQKKMPRVSISWKAVSVCCSHAAREMVVPGKDLKGGPCGPTSALAEGSQVLEHNTRCAKFEPQHLLLGKVLGEQSRWDFSKALEGAFAECASFIKMSVLKVSASVRFISSAWKKAWRFIMVKIMTH